MMLRPWPCGYARRRRSIAGGAASAIFVLWAAVALAEPATIRHAGKTIAVNSPVTGTCTVRLLRASKSGQCAAPAPAGSTR